MKAINETMLLVTGGSGFLGSHCVLAALREGYRVKTTIRSLSKSEKVLEMLQKGGAKNLDQLTFIEADLTSDQNWDEAVRGCDYVLHTASPFPISDPENEDELIVPARDGALCVLKAAKEAHVKRVVMTSSFAAIGYSNNEKGYVFTEKDWTDISKPVSAYIKSKTIAEQAAWEYIHTKGDGMELAVINPTGIFGPTLAKDSSSSIKYIQMILSGMVKESPQMAFGIIDVRDVADLHLTAMTGEKAAGERFLATTNEAMSFYDVAELIRKERPEAAGNIAKLEPVAKDYYKRLSNEKACSLLGWNPRPKEEAILATVDSLIR